MEAVLQWVSQYGYLGIFTLMMLGIVGLPVPDEWLLMFTGYLIYRGDLSPAPALGAAFLGSCCGISLSYLLGTTLGASLIGKYGWLVHVDRNRLATVHAWFERIGKWLLLVGYFIPGVRHLTAFCAGISKLRPAEFALFAFSGALFWSVSFVVVGYVVGEKWRIIADWISSRSWLMAGLAVAAGLCWYLLWRWWSKRQAGKG